MNSRISARIGALALIGAVAAAAVVAAPASAAPAASDDGACAVSGGTLSWGMKESFRAYISGSIANGSWETSDGADYETPDFLWSDGAGELDPATGAGSVSFTGTLHFTGHDGVLDLTLANPTIEFDGDGGAALLLDTRGTDMEGEVAVDTQQEWVGDVEVGDGISPESGSIEIVDAPTTLTNSGAGAFSGFYEAGEELDPISLTLDTSACAAVPAAEPAAEEPTDAAAPVEAEQAAAPASTEIPWLPIGVGGAALLIIGLTLGVLIGGRSPRRAAASAATGRAPGDQGGAA